VLQWKWSEMDFELEWGIASEMAPVPSVIVIGMVLELQMASGMPAESKWIGHISFDEIHDV
jgi:hypothetical protein